MRGHYQQKHCLDQQSCVLKAPLLHPQKIWKMPLQLRNQLFTHINMKPQTCQHPNQTLQSQMLHSKARCQHVVICPLFLRQWSVLLTMEQLLICLLWELCLEQLDRIILCYFPAFLLLEILRYVY